MLSTAEKLPEQVETEKCREAKSLGCTKKGEGRRPHPVPRWRMVAADGKQPSNHAEMARARISSHSDVGFGVFPHLEVVWKTVFSNACSHLRQQESTAAKRKVHISGRKTLGSYSLLPTRQHVGICKARSKGCSELKVRKKSHR